MLAGEGHDRLVRALALGEIGLERMKVLNRPLDAVADHHGPGLAANLVERHHLLVEMVHHDSRLQPDGVVVALDILPQLLLRLPGVELGVALNLQRVKPACSMRLIYLPALDPLSA